MAVEDVRAVVAEHRWDALAPLLDTAAVGGASAAMDYPWALHLLAHIYNGSLAEATALWKRVPLVARKASDVHAVHELLQLCWSRRYSDIWAVLQLGVSSWDGSLRPLARALLQRKRAELIEMLLEAYSTIKPSKVASMCGLSEADAIAACCGRGWQLSIDGSLLLSPTRAQACSQGAAPQVPSLVHSS